MAVTTRTASGIKYDTAVKEVSQKSSPTPTPTKSTGSGDAKLAASKASRSSSSMPTPAEYNKIAEQQKKAQQSAATPQKVTSTFTSPSLISSNLDVLKAVPSPVKPGIPTLQYIEDKALTSKGQAVPTARELENIRAIIGAGYQKDPRNISLGGKTQAQSMMEALKKDIAIRENRIDTREQNIFKLEKRLENSANFLPYYNKYIKDGVFVGTDKQYNDYMKAYNQYEKLFNEYNRQVVLYNEDVNTFNKNTQSINSKKNITPIKTEAKKFTDIYNKANKAVSKRLPSVEKVTPAIERTLKTASITPIPGVNPYNILNSNKYTRPQAKKILEANIGMYQAVKDKPVKAAATFATFFVGGVALKGLGRAAKAAGAGKKATAIARGIEKGMVGVYVLDSGRRVVTSKDARQFGYNTGDIIFNELLPASMGLKVVNKLPSGAKTLKNFKAGSKTLARSERASLGRDTSGYAKKKTTYAELSKKPYKGASDNFQKQFDDIIRFSDDLDNLNLKKSVARSQSQSKAAEAEYRKQKADDNVAGYISKAFAKQRAAGDKQIRISEIDSPGFTGSKSTGGTVKNLNEEARKLAIKAVRLQQKYESGTISKSTYDRQKKSIMQKAAELATFRQSGTSSSGAVSPSKLAGRKPARSLNAGSKAVGKTKPVQKPKQKPNTASKAKTKSKPKFAVVPKTKGFTKQAVKTPTAPRQIQKPSEKTRTPTPISIRASKSRSQTSTPAPTRAATPKTTDKNPNPPRHPRPSAGGKGGKAIIPPIPPVMGIKSGSKKKGKVTGKRKGGKAKQRNINTINTFSQIMRG